jgi:cytochrome P450
VELSLGSSRSSLRRAASAVVARARGVRTFAAFARDQLGFLERLGEEQGDVAQFEVLGARFWLLRDPGDVEAQLVQHARSVGRDDYVQTLERALGLGLLTSDGELWRRQRRQMAQAFTPRRIATYAEAMVRVVARSLERWHDGATIHLHREMGRLAAEVVSDVLFGASVSSEDVTMVGDALEVLNEFFASSPEAILGVPAWMPTPRNRRMNAAVDAIDGLVFRILSERRAVSPRDDLLGTLLAAQDDDGVQMSDAQLRDEAVTLFLAGHETTALALAHTHYLLARNPRSSGVSRTNSSACSVDVRRALRM